MTIHRFGIKNYTI